MMRPHAERTVHPLEEVEDLLQRAYDAADRSAGRVSGVAHGPVLDLRATIEALVRRTRQIIVFEMDDRP